MAQLLLRYFANGNIQNNHEAKTPLHYAVDLCDEETVELLLIAGASPMVQDAQGKTCLDFASTPQCKSLLVDPPCGSIRCSFIDFPVTEATFGKDLALLTTRTDSGSELYIWLVQWGLQHISDCLQAVGYDDVDSMVDQMQSEYPLDRETLNRIGINLPGDCHRLLSHLIDEMYHRANTISVKQTPRRKYLRRFLQ